jgi:hypothetical protein
MLDLLSLLARGSRVRGAHVSCIFFHSSLIADGQIGIVVLNFFVLSIGEHFATNLIVADFLHSCNLLHTVAAISATPRRIASICGI